MIVAKDRTGPVGRALWYIEAHFAEKITLDDVAAAGGVSRFHLSRVFGMATDTSLAEYLRGRRLSEAARALANGAPDILQVALDAGYASHEAFSRAFREHFGLTPEMVRRQRHVTNIELTEALRMDTLPTVDLQPPRFEHVDRLLVAGIGERYASDSLAGIPAQWQRFVPYLDSVPARVGRATYGVCANNDGAGHFDYITGVEVRDFSGLPADWAQVRIADQRYAVFRHRDHISSIKNTFVAIYRQWLPTSGYEAASAPDFERYGEEFDGRTGLGGVEVWIPIVN